MGKSVLLSSVLLIFFFSVLFLFPRLSEDLFCPRVCNVFGHLLELY